MVKTFLVTALILVATGFVTAAAEDFLNFQTVILGVRLTSPRMIDTAGTFFAGAVFARMWMWR
ncbi:MAG: hypothetical protein HYS26_02135 [Candidatus Kaiserbacteria bacterium]|nr:MAG: hypothetical protein HYS26_02135 [Candidatus Kaiserbacteria bacterium]